jgi:hypothetical protein
MTFDRYIAVEKEDDTTVVCENVNSGHDYYWNNTV